MWGAFLKYFYRLQVAGLRSDVGAFLLVGILELVKKKKRCFCCILIICFASVFVKSFCKKSLFLEQLFWQKLLRLENRTKIKSLGQPSGQRTRGSRLLRVKILR